MWRMAWSGLAGVGRPAAVLGLLLALFACSVSIEEDVLADLDGQPPPAAAFELKSWLVGGKVTPFPAASTILRFVPLADGRSVAEFYQVEKDRPTTILPAPARLVPLGDGWSVLAMRDLMRHAVTTYALLRFAGGEMTIIPTAQAKVAEAYRSLGLEFPPDDTMSGPVDPFALVTAFRAATALHASKPEQVATLTFGQVQALPADWEAARTTGLLRLRNIIGHEYRRLSYAERLEFEAYLKPLAASGSAAADYLLAVGYALGRRHDDAERHGQLAVAAGLESAKVALGMALARKSDETSRQAARQLYAEAAAAGDSIAMLKLAQQQQAIADRIGWLTRSAAAGNAEAQAALADAHARGEGMPRSIDEARKLYEVAAAQGEPSALHALSVFMRAGHGGARDEAGANRRLMKAARRGSSAAQAELGLRLFKGEGFAADSAEALVWLGRARGREAVAQRHIGGIEALMKHPEVLSDPALQALFLDEKLLQAGAGKQIEAWCGGGLFAGEPAAMAGVRAECAREVGSAHEEIAKAYRSAEEPGTLLECIDTGGVVMPSPVEDILECYDDMLDFP